MAEDYIEKSSCVINCSEFLKIAHRVQIVYKPI